MSKAVKEFIASIFPNPVTRTLETEAKYICSRLAKNRLWDFKLGTDAIAIIEQLLKSRADLQGELTKAQKSFIQSAEALERVSAERFALREQVER